MFHSREGEVEPEDYSFVIARVAPDVMNGTRNTNAERYHSRDGNPSLCHVTI
jgi:hypothetical protein